MGNKKSYNKKQRQSTRQAYKILDHCRNHQNKTLKCPHQPKTNHDLKIIFMHEWVIYVIVVLAPTFHLSARSRLWKPFLRNVPQLAEWLPNWRVKYWAIRSSVRSFARTAHSFACSALLASLARSAALIRSLARSLTPELMGKRFLSMKWTRRFHTFSTLCASLHHRVGDTTYSSRERWHGIFFWNSPALTVWRISQNAEERGNFGGPSSVWRLIFPRSGLESFSMTNSWTQPTPSWNRR